MCGRFVSTSSPDEIARYFDAAVPEGSLGPSYNVAPTDDVYAVSSDGEVRRVDAFRWGLVPWWAKDPKVGARMINARVETLTSKNAYRDAFRRRRCLIPADGFYEWKKLADGKRKQPYYIDRPDGEPLVFAGLWEVWRSRDGQGEPLRSCTIITTTPNATLAELHDRMPVLLPPSAWNAWLDPTNDDLHTLGNFLVPAPSALLAARPVSSLVNDVRNNGPELVEPASPEELTA